MFLLLALRAIWLYVLFVASLGVIALAFAHTGMLIITLLKPWEELLRGTGVTAILALLSGLLALAFTAFMVSTVIIKCKLDKLFG